MIQVSVKWRLAVVARTKSAHAPQCHLIAVPAFDAAPANSVQTKNGRQEQRQRENEIEARFICHRTRKQSHVARTISGTKASFIGVSRLSARNPLSIIRKPGSTSGSRRIHCLRALRSLSRFGQCLN